jgi:hypothetical protein
MSRIRRALFLLVPAFSIGCSDDSEAPAQGATGGALIFGTGGSSASGAPGGGAPSGNGGRSSGGGSSNSSGGSASSDGGNSSGSGGAGGPSSGGSGNGGAGPGNGGSNPTGTGGSAGGGPTGLPVGALCANDSNCSPNVCCKMPVCAGPCECQPAANCPTSTQFLPCNSAADCAAYGGGKICCRASSGGQTMQYCTKTNGCAGTTLP